MKIADRLKRLEALERATPLGRAYDLAERGVPPEQWPDDALNAACEAAYRDWPELATLSDEDVARLCEDER